MNAALDFTEDMQIHQYSLGRRQCCYCCYSTDSECVSVSRFT